jgi:hypothetical protein
LVHPESATGGDGATVLLSLVGSALGIGMTYAARHDVIEALAYE